MKVIFLDIDGTLYDHVNKTVPESSLLAIKKAREKGHKVFVCTGRSLSESKLFINYDFDGFVFCAGSLVYIEKKRVFEKPLELEEVNRLVKLFTDLNLGYCLEGDAGAYCHGKSTTQLIKYFIGDNIDYEEGKKLLNHHGFYNMDYWDNRDKIFKICIYANKMEEYEELYKSLDGYNLTFSQADEKKGMLNLEITMKEYNKSTAAKIVLDHYGLTYEDAVGIGDSDNDFELLRDCGIGIAMGNALPKELEIADYITDTVDNDGIYKAFEHYDLI